MILKVMYHVPIVTVMEFSLELKTIYIMSVCMIATQNVSYKKLTCVRRTQFMTATIIIAQQQHDLH